MIFQQWNQLICILQIQTHFNSINNYLIIKPPLHQQERFHIDVARKPEDCGTFYPKQVDYTIILHNLRGLFFIPFLGGRDYVE